MRAHLLHGPWLPACLNCEKEIPLKRLKAVPLARRCIACQVLHDEYSMPPDSVMAEGAEGDDTKRIREESWCQTSYRSTTRRRVPQEAA